MSGGDNRVSESTDDISVVMSRWRVYFNDAGYELVFNHSSDRLPVDFKLIDKVTGDPYVTITGTNLRDDVYADCVHPAGLMEYGDDDECGECSLCGALCQWGWVDGEVLDDGRVTKERQPWDWHGPDTPNGVGGMVGNFIKELIGSVYE